MEVTTEMSAIGSFKRAVQITTQNCTPVSPEIDTCYILQGYFKNKRRRVHVPVHRQRKVKHLSTTETNHNRTPPTTVWKLKTTTRGT